VAIRIRKYKAIIILPKSGCGGNNGSSSLYNFFLPFINFFPGVSRQGENNFIAFFKICRKKCMMKAFSPAKKLVSWLLDPLDLNPNRE
jgi:hypothetical protein